MSAIFEIRPMSPELYRRDTRRSTLVVAVLFVAMAMLFSTLTVQLFGTAGGDNFRWNLGGVLVGLAVTVTVVRTWFWPRPWMAPAVYGWRLKRSLMRIGNVMHKVKAGVAVGDPTAMKLLRFYHLALSQMHQLDGNLSDLSQLAREIDQHREAMQAQGLDPEQNRLDPAWLQTIKGFVG